MIKFKHVFMILVMVCTATSCTHSFFPMYSSKYFTTDIVNDTINLGDSVIIYENVVNRPDLYYKKTGKGKWQVTRLSVIPPFSFDQWKPYLSVPTDTSILVSWKDIKVEQPYVEYGKQPDKLEHKVIGQSQLLSDETASFILHKVHIKGLMPNQRYYYRVAGNSQVYSFITQPKPGSCKKYRILVIGDHQMIDRSGYEWLMASAKRTFEQKYGSLDKNLNLLLNVGDQVDAGRLQYWERDHFYKSSYIATGIPVMTTMGNHDIHEDYDMKKYSALFSYEQLNYKETGSGVDDYYVCQFGSVLLVSINTEYPHTNDQQLKWLDEVIEKADKDPSVRFIISVCHRPAYGETYSDDVCEWLRVSAYPILGKSKKHVLNVNGHHHYYHRGQEFDNNFYHVVTGGAAWSQLWSESPRQIDSDWVQKTFDYWSYVILEFDPSTKKMQAESYSIGHPYIAHKNVCIDRFSIDLSDSSQPEKPELKITEIGGIDCVNASLKNKKGYNSTQLQVATDQKFEHILYSKVQHKENYFSDEGSPYYLPINQQKSTGSNRFIIQNRRQITTGNVDTTSKSKLYVRARHRNTNLQWSEWSETLILDVKNE